MTGWLFLSIDPLYHFLYGMRPYDPQEPEVPAFRVRHSLTAGSVAGRQVLVPVRYFTIAGT